MTSWSATRRRAGRSRASRSCRAPRKQRGRGALPGRSQGVRRHHPARLVPRGRHPRRRAGARLLDGGRWSRSDPDPRALKAKTHEWQLEFTEQGTFLVCDVWQDGTSDIGWEGRYSVYRDRITVKGNDGSKLTARVEIDGDRLRFTDVQPGPNTHEALTWGSKPFVKIAARTPAGRPAPPAPGGAGLPGPQIELHEDLRDVSLDGLRREVHPLADRRVGQALGDQSEHVPLALGQLVERAAGTLSRDEARHDRGIDHALALADPPQRVDEHRDVGHPFLEQVAGAARAPPPGAASRSAPPGGARARAPRSRSGGG